DGSMRDALSILDQAIASSSGRLTAEQVRNLVGAAPSGVLADVMRAVAQGSSEEVLRLVDKLLTEGHSPTHFARQMVRFLRNTTVAKIAGADSSLLQISGDERQRVARVAELFSEEDLARHLQIMLLTHGEIGYRTEQRFHLELGLLKMAHAPQAALEESEEMSQQTADSGILREAVLRALSDAGHHMLVSMLETGEWKLEASDLVIQVTSSATVIDMSLGADAKRLAIAAA